MTVDLAIRVVLHTNPLTLKQAIPNMSLKLVTMRALRGACVNSQQFEKYRS